MKEELKDGMDRHVCKCEKPKRCGDYPGSLGLALLGWTGPGGLATCNMCHICFGRIRADKGIVYGRELDEVLL